jgi:hypothetical protein
VPRLQTPLTFLKVMLEVQARIQRKVEENFMLIILISHKVPILHMPMHAWLTMNVLQLLIHQVISLVLLLIQRLHVSDVKLPEINLHAFQIALFVPRNAKPKLHLMFQRLIPSIPHN